MQTIRVWDLPLRLFHWLLAAAVAAAVITAAGYQMLFVAAAVSALVAIVCFASIRRVK